MACQTPRRARYGVGLYESSATLLLGCLLILHFKTAANNDYLTNLTSNLCRKVARPGFNNQIPHKYPYLDYLITKVVLNWRSQGGWSNFVHTTLESTPVSMSLP